jgi:hypothetical protein
MRLIEENCVPLVDDAQSKVVNGALTGEGAQALLAGLPEAEALLPRIDLEAIELLSTRRETSYRRRPQSRQPLTVLEDMTHITKCEQADSYRRRRR